MAKTQEQRVVDAARIIAKHDGYDISKDCPTADHISLAAAILIAADSETPKWPTDQIRDAFMAGYRGSPARPTPTTLNTQALDDGLRAAMLADPIFNNAINTARILEQRGVVTTSETPLVNAVKEAGLLDD